MPTQLLKAKSRRLIIARAEWRSEPAAPIPIRKIPSPAALLLWMFALQDFCLKLQSHRTHRRHRTVAPKRRHRLEPALDVA